MSDIPIVHGTRADNTSLQLEENGNDLTTPFFKGEVQPPAYCDVKFAYAFVVQMVGVVLTAVFYGSALVTSGKLDNDDEDDTNNNNNNTQQDEDDTQSGTDLFWVILVVSFIAAILTNMGMLSVMSKYSHAVVNISFLSAPVLLMSLALLISLADPSAGFPLMITALIFATISALVYMCYRRFIPFAASTLRAAMAVLQSHPGLYVLSGGGLVLSFAVTLLFFFAFAGILVTADQKGEVPCKELYDDPDNIYDDDEMCMKEPPNTFALLLLLLAYFWTQQVLQNVVHCTTAGAVGTWWFSGLADPSWCSHDITASLGRALSYSFGSICFGSLLVAIIQTLQHIAHAARRNRRGALLACIIECILSCIRAWLEYFNSWTFCYVGLYGYDYLTAGRNVVQLFQTQGWSTFASDRLIFRVLYASMLSVALFSGGMAALACSLMGGDNSDDDDNNNNNNNGNTNNGSNNNENGDDDESLGALGAFFLGCLLGLFLARCSMFVVESAVRTIIVCFAESPAEFQEHHPHLCQGMREGWAAAYPDVWNEQYDLRFAEVLPAAAGNTGTKEEKQALTMA